MKKKKITSSEQLADLLNEGKLREFHHRHWEIFKGSLKWRRLALLIIGLVVIPIVVFLSFVFILLEVLFKVFLIILLCMVVIEIVLAMLKVVAMTKWSVGRSITREILIGVFLGLGLTFFFIWVLKIPIYMRDIIFLSAFGFSFCAGLIFAFGKYFGYYRLVGAGSIHLEVLVILKNFEIMEKNALKQKSKSKKIMIEEFTSLLGTMRRWCGENYGVMLVNLDQVKQELVTTVLNDYSGFEERFKNCFNMIFLNELRESYNKRDFYTEVVEKISGIVSVDFKFTKESSRQKFKRVFDIPSWYVVVSISLSIISFVLGIIFSTQ